MNTQDQKPGDWKDPFEDDGQAGSDGADLFADPPAHVQVNPPADAPKTETDSQPGTEVSTEVKAPKRGKKTDLTKKPLVTLDPKEYVGQVFAPFHDQLAEAIKQHTATDYDITTAAGMATALARRRAFRTIRTSAENERKERKAPILEIGKLLDSTYKTLEAQVRPLEDAHDAIIQAEEARKEAIRQEELRIEQERVNNITAKIEKIASLPADIDRNDIARLTEAVDYWNGRLQAMDANPSADQEEFEEFIEQAREAMSNALKRLETMRTEAIAEQQRRAEEAAARQREKEERERIEAALAEERRKAAEIQAEAQRQREEAEARERAIREEAARQQAAMEEQMAAMQRQMQALQAQLNPPKPAEVEKDPRQVDIEDLVADQQQADSNLAEAQLSGEPFDPPQFEDGPAIVADARPGDEEIIQVVADVFAVDVATAREWILDIQTLAVA